MKKLNTRILRQYKTTTTTTPSRPLQMLTCYDYQTAQLLNQTELDLILVGDSLGNVILGHDTTIEVTLQDMMTFASAVKRGAPHKFVISDLPFGTYATWEEGIKNSVCLFRESKVEALKLEGAHVHHLQLIERLTQTGIPVMGHIGLTPQSVHEQGGYYIHGKDQNSAQRLLKEASDLQRAGVFSIVLECVAFQVAKKITEELSIPTIGIGSGPDTDGQVLVINDLLHLGPQDPPPFCRPMANFYNLKKEAITHYLKLSSKDDHRPSTYN